MKITPRQMRHIFEQHNPTGERYETWTQIQKLEEWPPAESFALIEYQGYILVGASAVDKAALDVWRRKHTVYAIPRTTYTLVEGQEPKPYTKPTISNANDEAWLEMHLAGMRQGEIAKALGVSNAYVSIIKRKMKHLGRISA